MRSAPSIRQLASGCKGLMRQREGQGPVKDMRSEGFHHSAELGCARIAPRRPVEAPTTMTGCLRRA